MHNNLLEFLKLAVDFLRPIGDDIVKNKQLFEIFSERKCSDENSCIS